MKKILIIGLCLIMCFSSVYAAEGEMGSFGGVSTGVKMDTLTALAQDKKKSTTKYKLPYKENIYISGEAVTVEGTIEITPGTIDKEDGKGSFTEKYVVSAQNADNTASITRDITLETQYVYDASLRQTTKVSTVKKWTRDIVEVNGISYALDKDKSTYSKSILEDYTPGVSYYRGDIQYDAVYRKLDDSNSYITVSVNGPIYGYDQAFAKTETQKRNITVDLGNGNGYSIEETPTLTVYRDIEYGVNEPTAMSMAGNFKEIIRGEGVLSYNILKGRTGLYNDNLSAMLNVSTTSSIEQLSYPTNLNLNGHPAETEIKKMYSLKVFEDNPSFFSTNQVVTKGEYVTMLVKALQIEMPEEKKTTSRNSRNTQAQVEVSPFNDIAEGNKYYKYAVAAYKAGLVDGGTFAGDTSLTREMLYLLNIKAMGLTRLGLGIMDTYTPFVDDNQISSWAKSSLYAASKLGLITVENGYIFPQKKVTKAECATLLDQFISYLRYDLQKDYNDKMLLG